MKVLAIGFKRMTGKAKESGNVYDMAKLSILLPQTAHQNATSQSVSAGYQAADLDVEPSFFSKFIGFDYPCNLELQVQEEMIAGKGGRIETRRKAVSATLIYSVDITQGKKPELKAA